MCWANSMHKDRAAIEQLLETSDEARALVEELRMATTMLKDEFAGRIAGGVECGPACRDTCGS